MAAEQLSGGVWRTLRNPPAPQQVGTALAYLLSEAAALARGGQGGKAIAMRQALDVVGDFVRFEPLPDTPDDARHPAPPLPEEENTTP